jgi:hypothetical protein
MQGSGLSSNTLTPESLGFARLAADEVNVRFLMYIIISTHVKSEVTEVYIVCVIMYNSH